MSDKASRKHVTSKTCGCAGQCENCKCKEGNDARKTVESGRCVVVTAMIWLLVLGGLGWGQSSGTDAGQGAGRPGLLIIAHGSPAPRWNQLVLEQEQKVRAAFGADNTFAAIKVVFMEFAEPNVADGLMALQEANCHRIVAVPLLVAPSSHSHWDIPALLGLYSDPDIEEMLREEGARLVRPNVPVTLTTTLAEGNVIERVMLKRVRQLSIDPDKEALVLLAHGSEAIPPAWDRFLKRTVTYICGRTGISYGDWATVAVGQEYSRGIVAMQEAAEHRERVIVVGAYLSLGTKRMHARWLARRAKQGAGMHGAVNPLDGLDIRFSEQGLLPDAMVTQWIVETARGELQRHP